MFIKRPGGTRQHYALVGKEGKTVYDDRIDAVNLDLEKGFSRDVLEQRMRAIKDSFRPIVDLTTVENLKIANLCHEAKVIRKPALANHYTLHRRLIRAVEALGPIPLTTASEEQILDRLKEVKHPGVRRHVLGGLNELLRFLKRDMRLYNPKPTPTGEVVYIELDSWPEVLKQVPQTEWRVYLTALFALGTRLGELPGAQFLPDNQVWIAKQLTVNKGWQPLKNKNPHMTTHLPPLYEGLEAFKKYSPETVNNLRLKDHTRMLQVIKKATGKDEVNIHSLRASFVVAWFKSGASLEAVAKMIGDSESVTKDHYARFQPKADEMTRLRALFK